MSEMNEEVLLEIDKFVESWSGGGAVRAAFLDLLSECQKAAARIEFHVRPGVSNSLRAYTQGDEHSLVIMVDAVEDADPWLSVCFYAEHIQDPEERGECIPGGLLGQDGYCFEVGDGDDALSAYLCNRFKEAWKAAV